ncbi:MAG: EamA family transporter [Armatimonadetes bacterium]|nr:EamA family transporter [Armatimonadota bacterium]
MALAAAVLFGLTTPLAKLLLGATSPGMLAALLYLGSGLGLGVILWFRPAEAPLSRRDWPWLAGAILCGGVLAPLSLMWGLTATPAGSASLLLNLEGVFTALIAWFVFRENFDRRIMLGMALIVAGGAALSWSGPGGDSPGGGSGLASLGIVAACLGWGLDNNLTQKVSAQDPVQLASLKGLVAGGINLMLALAAGHGIPAAPALAGALLLGFVGYGVSLALFVLALRHIGTARTGAYFSVAPFVGAAIALPLLREPLRPGFALATVLMAAGVWLHLTERHEHEHYHPAMEHCHRHSHDEHHQHEHPLCMDVREPHTHWHVHQPLTHAHAHYPDIHHRHAHGGAVERREETEAHSG